MNSRQAGSAWETRAESFLIRKGLIVIDRNFHCRGGEIDLVMRDGDELVFVEVRFRRCGLFGSGADSIGPAKQRRIVLAARYFLLRHRRLRDLPCRFDVISVGEENGQPHYQWIQNAFDDQRGF